jgi:ribonuclease P protein component
VNKQFRLKKSSDFQRVRRLGKAIAHPFVVLLHLPNEGEQVRVGVAAGKKLGNAVQRNRAKRVLRAGIQPLLAGIKPGHDLVLIAREPILDVKSTEVEEALRTLLKKANLSNQK